MAFHRYEVAEPVAFPFRPGQFDNSYLENAVITYSPHDEGYLLTYTTSPPGIARNTLNWEGNGGNVTGLQDIGMAFSKDPMKGEWKRLNRTILKPYTDGYEGGIAINPAVLTFPNGTVRWRSTRAAPRGGRVAGRRSFFILTCAQY